ncbi:LacI family DNA-binding transcriptional regulator [Chryseomicrobium palamuruense]|uniref:LacI family DNA-binding transcriptional regulator n=1 Tax=Chryseomicrobium palamuruense TaxID=682973 RepID=A0ABV8UT63_9BACL
MTKWTIKDIAKKAGVSITTVSRVLNRKEEGMSEETRQKVLRVMEELDYQPNRLARGLVTKQSKLIGLIVPTISNPFFPELCRGAEDEANAHGYSLVICNSDASAEKEEHYITILKEQQVDGLILSSRSGLSSTSLLPFLKNVHYVHLDRMEEEAVSGVRLDNEAGGYLAGKHLLELGHTKIGCISGPNEIRNSRDRVAGFTRALAEANLEPVWIQEGDFSLDSAYQHAMAKLEETDVTAIFTCNDMMACGVYRAAHGRGMAIPKELSVIGFDDVPLVSALIPKLTTIRQDTYAMGRKAAALLVQQIEEGTTDFAIFEPTLVVRESTAYVPTGGND